MCSRRNKIFGGLIHLGFNINTENNMNSNMETKYYLEILYSEQKYTKLSLYMCSLSFWENYDILF